MQAFADSPVVVVVGFLAHAPPPPQDWADPLQLYYNSTLLK